MSTWFLLLCQFSIIAFALLGGVFLAFSDFIMRALGNTSQSGGIEAMQIINREVFRWAFMTLFIGMVPVSLIILGYAATTLSGPGAVLLMLAAGAYLLGVFAITAGFNVPLNTALDAMDPNAEATAQFWTTRYVPDWTFWNTLRTFGSIISASLTLIGTVILIQT